jgi:hypothetical protein
VADQAFVPLTQEQLDSQWEAACRLAEKHTVDLSDDDLWDVQMAIYAKIARRRWCGDRNPIESVTSDLAAGRWLP